jgi:exopolysaccharide biosynthesis polyprenyl glycosylphosphotransferase
MTGRNQIKNPLWFFIIFDFLLIMVSLYLVLIVRFKGIDRDFINLHYRIFTPLFLIWLVVLFIHNLFDFRTLRSYFTLTVSLISAMFFNLIIAVVYFYFQPNLLLTPRRTLLGVVFLSFVLILCWHLLIKYFLKNRFVESFYLFSINDDLAELEAELARHSYMGLRIVRHVRDLSELENESNAKVIIFQNLLADDNLLKQIYDLRLKGLRFYNHLEFYENLLKRIPLTHLGELWFLNNIEFRENRMQTFIRKSIDLLAGLLLFCLFILTFPFIALAILITSSGPLFFVQERVGKRGEIFKVYKYRTMTRDSSGKGWTEINDSRITKIGKVLRRTHLDELPQFMNLLAGHMSIVGPRPEQEEIVSRLRQQIPFYDERHLVKPGLTGWAQLHIYASTLEETRRKLEYDLYYMKHRSLFFDLEIVLKTLYFIITSKSE